MLRCPPHCRTHRKPAGGEFRHDPGVRDIQVVLNHSTAEETAGTAFTKARTQRDLQCPQVHTLQQSVSDHVRPDR